MARLSNLVKGFTLRKCFSSASSSSPPPQPWEGNTGNAVAGGQQSPWDSESLLPKPVPVDSLAGPRVCLRCNVANERNEVFIHFNGVVFIPRLHIGYLEGGIKNVLL